MANTPSLKASARLLSMAPGRPVPVPVRPPPCQLAGRSAGAGRGGGGRRRGVRGRRRRLDGAGQELGDVDDFEGGLGLAVGLLGVDGVAEHDQAVGAGGGDGVGVGPEGLVDPLGVDPLADPFLHPHPGPAAPQQNPRFWQRCISSAWTPGTAPGWRGAG